MSPCKMINLFQDVETNVFPENMSYGWGCPPLCPLGSCEQSFKTLQFFWLIGHNWSPKITKHCMSGHIIDLVFKIGLNTLVPQLVAF